MICVGLLWSGSWQLPLKWCSHFGKHLGVVVGSVHVGSQRRGLGLAGLLALDYTQLGSWPRGRARAPGSLVLGAVPLLVWDPTCFPVRSSAGRVFSPVSGSLYLFTACGNLITLFKRVACFECVLLSLN